MGLGVWGWTPGGRGVHTERAAFSTVKRTATIRFSFRAVEHRMNLHSMYMAAARAAVVAASLNADKYDSYSAGDKWAQRRIRLPFYTFFALRIQTNRRQYILCTM